MQKFTLFFKMKKIEYKILFILFIFFPLKWKNNKKQTEQVIEHKILKLKYIKNLKKVVYTALLGNYDAIHSIVKEKGYDYIMFTDQNFDNNSDSNWTFLDIGEMIKYLNINIIKRQRYFKTQPHLFFRNYDLSIYIDSTFEIKGQLDELLLRILTPKKSVYFLEHPDRNKINNEFQVVAALHKDSNRSIISVQNKCGNLISK